MNNDQVSGLKNLTLQTVRGNKVIAVKSFNIPIDFPFDISDNTFEIRYNDSMNSDMAAYDDAYPGHGGHGAYASNFFSSSSTTLSNTIPGRSRTSELLNTYYIYTFDGKLLAEYDHNGNCTRDYIYFGDRLIAEYKPQTNEYFYYMTDQINSTRIITNDSGNVVFSEAYGPYGDVQKTWTSTYDPKLKFSGKEREGYSDLDYFGARYYDHKSYRFNSIDPIINKAEALVNPQLWNLYTYCGNNPITYFDPDGMLYGRFGYIKHPVESGRQIPNNPGGFTGAARANFSTSCTPAYDNGVIRPEFRLELFVDVWFTTNSKNHEMRHVRDVYYAFSKLMIIAKYIEENVTFTNMEDFNEFISKQLDIFKSYMDEQVKKSKALRDTAYLGWIDLFQSFIPLSGINNGSDVPESREWDDNKQN